MHANSESSAPPAAATPTRAVLVAAIASAASAAAAAIAVGWPMDEFCLDDAYIHLSYARSLRLGDGLSYNPHDWELGATSPLWVLVLALLPALTPGWVKLLGVALHALGAGVVSLVAVELRADAQGGAQAAPTSALVAGLLFAFHPLLLHASTSGMEVPLVVLLLSGTVLATLRRALPLAAVLAALCVWARLEAVVVTTACAALAAVRSDPKRAVTLAPAIGGVVGLGLLSLYCQIANDALLPNTVYLKARLDLLGGLAYLVLRVLRHEGWLLTLACAGLVGLFTVREARADRWTAAVLSATWLLTLLAIAVTRRLDLGIQFYGERYFALASFIPPVLVGASLGAARRRALSALVPVGLFLCVALPASHEAVRAQERDIRLLHTEPAQWVATHLPPDAVVLVEGAGAMRFYTPRSMTILDLVGLNDRLLAHTEPRLWPCVWVARRPGFLAIPTELGPRIQQTFVMSLLEQRDDPAYSQVLPPSPRSLFVLQVRGITGEAMDRCTEALEAR